MIDEPRFLGPGEIEPPQGLSDHALFAWRAAIDSLGSRSVTRSDLLTLEAGCRAWARWKAIEEKIADLAKGNVVAGELTKSQTGTLQTSALRTAANAAFAEWNRAAAQIGIVMPEGRSRASGLMAEGPAYDLLGDPIPDGFGKRGRPPHIPTQQNRNKIMLLLAQGWTDQRIAGALGITTPTLRKHYFRELRTRDVARDRAESIGLLTLWEQGRAGNIAAMKEYFRRHDAAASFLFEGEVEERRERIGKKERLRREADNPPDDWEAVTPLTAH